jgi:hypothetical protein
MQILGYGEDALTLWAIKNKLDVILETVGDSFDPSMCQMFFRPSFGRRGGDSSPQFGEFDFIILSKDRLYLGESKWVRSSEKLKDGILELRVEQKRRHEVFKFYVEQWAFGSHSSWREFTDKAQLELESGVVKPLAPTNSLLAANLKTVLGVIKEHYASMPDIRNMLLYLHDGAAVEQLPQKVSEDFDLVCIDYSGADTLDNFIRIKA